MNLKQNEKDLWIMAAKAAEFMKRQDPSVESWEDPIAWCMWYFAQGFMVALCANEDGRILALAAARPVNDPTDGNVPYKHVSGGSCIFVDWLGIENSDPLILPTFAMEMRQRFGDRKIIAFHRVKTHDYEGFMRNISRINFNVRTPYYGTEAATA